MSFLDSLKVAFHRFTGDTQGQLEDLKKLQQDAASAPRGSNEEAVAFCLAQDQSTYIAKGEGMSVQEFNNCYQGFRQFQGAQAVINSSPFADLKKSLDAKLADQVHLGPLPKELR